MPRPWVRFAVMLVLLAGATTAGLAQEAADEAGVGTEALGVSLDRIKHRLDRLPERDEVSTLLKLDFYIDVYARAPEIDYFHGFDLENSPVAVGTPMHGELLGAMRSGEPHLLPPAMNLSNLLSWLQQRSR